MRRLYPYLLLFATLAPTGCMSRNYMEVFDFPEERWGENQSVVFTFRPVVPLENEPRVAEWIDIVVRHRDDFPHADLLLEIKGIRPDKVFWVDTVGVRLAERSAERTPQERPRVYHWVGRHYSNHYELTCRYRDRIRYRHETDDTNSSEGFRGGRYAVSVRQINGRELNGILSVGIVASGCQGITID